jgi:hypothetical protein
MRSGVAVGNDMPRQRKAIAVLVGFLNLIDQDLDCTGRHHEGNRLSREHSANTLMLCRAVKNFLGPHDQLPD